MIRAVIKLLLTKYSVKLFCTMPLYECSILLIFASLSSALFDIHRPGWLDKVVEYHKNKLFEDFQKVSDVEVKATIQPTPEGYVDSPDWNYDSVTRLLILIRESKKALPVRRVLRRMLGNTRRKMSVQQSYKVFPSLSKDINNDLYYDASGEMYDGVITESGFIGDKDQGIIIVSNPVEARLPSAMISINLMREILEARAKAARYMQTTRKTIPWKTMTKTPSSKTPAQNSTKQEYGGTSTEKPEGHTGTSGNAGVPGTGTAAVGAITTATTAS